MPFSELGKDGREGYLSRKSFCLRSICSLSSRVKQVAGCLNPELRGERQAGGVTWAS